MYARKEQARIHLRRPRSKALAVSLGACVLVASGLDLCLAAEADVTHSGFADLGLLLEQAKQSGTFAPQEAQTLEVRLQALLESEKNADPPFAKFLSAEIQFVSGNFERSRELFRDAAKQAKGTPFADDATLGAIEALEAAGKDQDAEKAWRKWEKKYPHSALAGEVRLARLWNALRRLDLEAASQLSKEIKTEFAWMTDDSRVLLAEAALAYYDGRFGEALETLAGESIPEAGYLRALCHDASGTTLKAAAEFQEVTSRAHSVALRDHAAFAKANTFFDSKAYRSAAEEFARVAETTSDPSLRAEAGMRRGAALSLEDDVEAAIGQLNQVLQQYPGTAAAGRAQFLLGEIDYAQGRYADAILQFNRVLENYFEASLAATAQYRIARSLDALGRGAEATGSYQAVVSGYALEREAPAAAYLAGVGLLEQGTPRAAAPYFQLVLDRYARQQNGTETYVFESTAHQELVEAALCLLQLSYHRAGDLGQLSGVPHLALARMPASRSVWRAYALLIDADALASVGRYAEAQATLEKLTQDFSDYDVALQAHALLAWTYSQQDQYELAIAAQEQLLKRAAASGNVEHASHAFLNQAHVLFNRKHYKKAAIAYEEFLRRFPAHPKRPEALYQVGLVYVRLDRNGDAVDRWEALVQEAPSGERAEAAWVRAGDLYFRAEQYEDAKRCYAGLLENFPASRARANCSLRLAQCEYNAGNDAEALQAYSQVAANFPGTEAARQATAGVEQSLYRLGQNNNGIEVLSELVERYPSSSFAADAQFQVAQRHYEAKRFTEAADSFRRVVTQFPAFSAADEAHFLMADAYEQAGNTDAAVRAFEQFTRFFPDAELRSTAEFRLASLNFAAQEYARASVGFLYVYEANAGDDMKKASLYNLALCQKQLGDAQQTQTFLAKYQEKYPGDERAAEVGFQLGDLADRSGATDQAVTHFTRALKAGAKGALQPQIQYRLGAAHETLGEPKAAMAVYKKAQAFPIKDDPFRLSAVVRLAALYEEGSQYKLALGAYKDLIRHADDAQLVTVAKERVAQLEETLQ